MRHTSEELADILLPLSPRLIEAVGAGIASAARSKVPHLLEPHKRALYSHVVRSGIFDHLRENDIEGFVLDEGCHSLNQSVVLRHKSGLELRFTKLRSIARDLSTPRIPQLDSLLDSSGALFGLERKSQLPGVVGLSWERPKLDDEGYPLEELEVTAVRAAAGRRLRDGFADVVIPLSDPTLAIPEEAFDPNADDVIYRYEVDEADNA
ncbi:hypothetical protein EAH68_02710 [Corynebacterium hylobatis]|uniref:Uncharacterized protein n=1 Tax=Corynebacterium hylobatis TaxID=1859290 RepID=A0A430I0P6_9CORY|nr:hypothetical protein [Corynebacterium hylobatis]RSZ65077.1 hypothetical protein EAH68_02710 [Corynebacterium hylobatis]